MKKTLVVAAGLALLSGSAYATKARMQALGWSSANGLAQGARTYSDTRSVFKNPAFVNEYTNYVVTEWGAAITGATGDDTEAAPPAEGGFFRSAGNFNYGLYFGNEDNANNCVRTGAAIGAGCTDHFAIANAGIVAASKTGEAGFLSKDNVLDIFFGGDAGVQWGVNLQLARQSDDQTTVSVDKSHFSLGLNFGILMGALDAYLRAQLVDKSEGASHSGDEWKKTLPLTVGLGYGWRGHNFWFEVEKDGFDYSDTSGASGTTVIAEGRSIDVRAGWGRTHKISDSARVYTDAYLSYHSSKVKAPGTSSGLETKRKLISIPLIVGVEADANSWLTLRGSVTHSLISEGKNTTYTLNQDSKKISTVGQTGVNAGATLNFGKLKLDGMVGTTTQVAGRAVGGATGLLSLDNLMSRVALHYWF